jgi:hypothetical protein
MDPEHNPFKEFALPFSRLFIELNSACILSVSAKK